MAKDDEPTALARVGGHALAREEKTDIVERPEPRVEQAEDGALGMQFYVDRKDVEYGRSTQVRMRVDLRSLVRFVDHHRRREFDVFSEDLGVEVRFEGHAGLITELLGNPDCGEEIIVWIEKVKRRG